ncbi:SWIM zinc finger family protein [Actinacidiphila sp. ITFR-21]|uniref:SWIM zinc finger family protein n=1 Tax=Actinacidiphila sp. ITFR-21 TaxID=3075199 RepID=UPI00288C0A0D|nr:SWIM zinc finger family protein [Streptomyces sp. ITFR-21]WNI17357.1 SWIM zinc finger family protein [Streptomyces sp. ITFR-21]
METEARWTVDQVLALAPDAASRKAGARLGAPAPWTGTGAAGGALWGLCKGSGSKPYQTAVDLDGPAFRCTCPSRKFPCKHALGLLLLWAEGGAGPVAAAAEPDWVEQWTSARRKRTESAQAAPPRVAGPADPDAARRRADRRAVRVEGGAAELEQRLADLLRGGLAGADRGSYRQWDEIAARMVDAQAPGLAARVRELGAVAATGGDWPSRMLEETALLHLLARGFLGREGLPGPLAETVRARIGYTVDSAELLAGPTVGGQWLVLAQYDAADDRLTTRRVWLYDEGAGRFALLLSFGAAGRAPELALPVGSLLDAELAYHPSALPLRAALGPHGLSPALPHSAPRGTAVAPALASYGTALADDPWLDAWPVLLSAVVPLPGPDRWQLADAATEDALPVATATPAAARWRLAAVSGGHPTTVFGELGPTGLRPLAVWPEGAAEPIPL